MNLFGINVNSLMTPEVKFIVSKMRFVSSLGEEFPALVSFNQNQQVLRELIVVRRPILKGHQILPGYKYLVESREDGKLSSLADDKKVIMGIKARKSKFGITTSLVFIGLKGELDKILVIHDVPVVASNRKELIEGVKEFMKEWVGIEIEDAPCTIRGVRGEKIKVVKMDVDYATLLL